MLATPDGLPYGVSKVNEKIKVAQYGLDPLGREVIKQLNRSEECRLVAAIDPDPAFANRSVSDVTQISGFADVPVVKSFSEMRKSLQPEAIFHTMGRGVTETLEQLRPLCESSLNVITSCEEMLFPWHRASDPAHELDAICRLNGALVVGAGTEPGAALNLLPISMVGLTVNIQSVSARSPLHGSLFSSSSRCIWACKILTMGFAFKVILLWKQFFPQVSSVRGLRRPSFSERYPV